MQKQAVALALLTLSFAFSSHASRSHPEAQPPRYAVTQILPTLPEYPRRSPDVWYEVAAFNDRGQVVGNAGLSPISAAWPSTVTALLWQHGHVFKIGSLPGYGNSAAFGINNQGQVIGYARTVQGRTERAFLWQNGKMRDLGTLPGGHVSKAYGINNRGEIVGVSDGIACLWSQGKARALGRGEARAINDQGQVLIDAGPLTASDQHQCFLWEKGRRTFVGNGIPCGLNNRGQVIFIRASNPFDSYLWQRGKVRELKTLSITDSFAARINDLGQIMGELHSDWGLELLWQHGKTYNLNDLLIAPTRLSLGGSSAAINNRGQIVCDSDKGLVLLSPVSRQ